MKFLCVICSKKERTHIGVNGGEHVTLCDSVGCWDKFKKRSGGGVKIKTIDTQDWSQNP